MTVVAGNDLISCPNLGRAVADRIPGALFEVMEGEAHQPFQEVPHRWNERVNAIWKSVEESA